MLKKSEEYQAQKSKKKRNKWEERWITGTAIMIVIGMAVTTKGDSWWRVTQYGKQVALLALAGLARALKGQVRWKPGIRVRPACDEGICMGSLTLPVFFYVCAHSSVLFWLTWLSSLLGLASLGCKRAPFGRPWWAFGIPALCFYVGSNGVFDLYHLSEQALCSGF